MGREEKPKLCRKCLKIYIAGDVDQITSSLASCCKINTRCPKDGSTPLMIAANLGHHNAVDALLARNPDVNVQDFSGDTALMLASEAGHCQCVQSLLYSWSSDLDRRNNSGSTALILSASSLCNEGHLYCIKLLLEQDADVNIKNDMHMTALMYCVNSFQFGLPVFQMLVEAGAHTGVLDDEGESLLMLAVRRRNLHILDHLLTSSDLNLNFQNNNRDNVLIIALVCSTDNDYSHIVNRLLNAGCDPNSKSGRGCSALNIAAASSFKTTLNLISHGAIPKLSMAYLRNGVTNITEREILLPALHTCGSVFLPTDVSVLNGQFSIANYLLTFVGCRSFLFESFTTIPSNDSIRCAKHQMMRMIQLKNMTWLLPKVIAYTFRPKSLMQLCMGVISPMAGTSLHGRRNRLITSGLPPVLVKSLFMPDFEEKHFM